MAHFFVLVLLSFRRVLCRLADCQVHLFDFLQSGEFNTREGAFPGSSLGLLEDVRYARLPAGKRDQRVETLLAALLNSHVEGAIV